MISATCIQKIKTESGRIQSYILQDIQGKVVEISAIELKQAMQNNQIRVVNLKLTKDNRIANTKVDRVAYLTNSLIKKINCTKALSFKSNVNINNIKLKANIVGSKFTQLEMGGILIRKYNKLSDYIKQTNKT